MAVVGLRLIEHLLADVVALEHHVVVDVRAARDLGAVELAVGALDLEG